ncbi:MAG: substrate-binding domain-containing protein [Dehalococcoidia bacterium]|nr:substrate-binding domain-containing protein [Dehalococcoidia bacterium]
MTATTIAPEAMLAQVEPVLRRYAPVAEVERRLPPELADALIDAGMFRVWTPRSLGGLELDPIASFRLFEELSRIDGSAGWVVGNAGLGPYISQMLPDAGAAEVLADPRTVIAGVYNPPGAAIPVEGGYRVTGRWPFGSACHFANWLNAPCLIMDGDAPRLGPDGNPLLLSVLFRREEAEILDTWHTMGMRGTGSADFAAKDVFVPERRSFVLGPFDHPGSAFTGPLYRFGMWLDPARIAITGLGIARAALDAFMELANMKTPTLMQTALADRSSVQDGVARARALIDAARSYVYTVVGDAWQFVQSGAADAGIIALSLALAPTMRDAGRSWEPPLDAYPRLEQGGIILKRAHDLGSAIRLRDFVLGQRGREILQHYGFLLPQR